ncbi:MAG: DUF3160 domain-containing protein [Mobilitalea sp.]
MKRVIVIVLCLCLIITGCQGKKKAVLIGENSPTPKQEAANITAAVEASNPDNGSQTVETLLKLDKAWAVIQTVELEQAGYEVPTYEADVEPYTIAKDLSNIENINQFNGFTKEQINMLASNGFVVLPSNQTRINYVYDSNEYRGIPNFVTSDVVLHMYHQFYDKSLMGVELNYLYKDLDLMTKQMLEKSILLQEQLKDEDLIQLQNKNIVYFLVARMLVLGNSEVPITVEASLLELAKQEYDLIAAAEGVTRSPLLQVDLDYSQFTVRGHYTRAEELGRFFKAMMWFGYTPLALEQNGEILYENVLQALLINFTTIAESEEISDAQLWSNIYQPTSQYVGLSDDINVFTLNGVRNKVFAGQEDPNTYNDEEYKDKLIAAVKELPEPQIQAVYLDSDQPTEKQFKFMGQRYILDSDILQTLMKPIVRPLPTALDVMGVLGSDTAENLIFNVYKPQENWPEYTQRYQKLEEEVGGYSAGYWQGNLYRGWLSSIKSVLTEYDSNSGMPLFMQNEAWKYKSLNAALGSYTELKHDTVLYGKQSAAEMGGPIATAGQQYVEPNVELYYKLLYLTDATSEVLKDKDMLNNVLREGVEEYKEFLNLLITCSIKELKNEALSEQEVRELLWCGGTIENVINSFVAGSTGDITAKDPTDMLVTDIATGGDTYLTLGTGYFDEIYVVVPYNGKLYLSLGSVYSFYEFTSNQRLTDEEWWKLQGINVVHEEYGDYVQFDEISDQLPKQPDWISSFKTLDNNVEIISLETIWEDLAE